MEEKIYEFIKSYLESRAPLNFATKEELLSCRYLDHGHIDSFGIINFIVALEEEFGITLESQDTESDEFRYVGGLVELIARKLQEPSKG
ncbi:MAG: acyl carrier protein [Campylobacterales bacterium]